MTRTGEFVIDLDSPHKKPYETLIIGRFKSTKSSDANQPKSCLSDPITTDKTNTMVNTSSDKETIEDTIVCTDGKESRHLDKCREKIGLQSIPTNMVICSVPCQIHSRKPPLSGKQKTLTKNNTR